MQLSNNTNVITGGTSGIGLGLARRFAAAGHRVIICGRRKECLEQISRANRGIEAVGCDVSHADERRRSDVGRASLNEV